MEHKFPKFYKARKSYYTIYTEIEFVTHKI